MEQLDRARRGYTVVVMSLCIAAVAVLGAWRAPAPATPTAIAVVNLSGLFEGLLEVKEGMDLIGEQKKAADLRVKEAVELHKKLVADLEYLKDLPLSERLQKMAIINEAAAMAEARATIAARVRHVEAGALMRRVFLKVEEAALKMAKQDGWDLILIDDRETTPPEYMPGEDGKDGRRITLNEVRSILQQRQLLVIAADRIDVTSSLVEFMNGQYKSGQH